MNLFGTIRNAVYNPEFYKSLEDKSIFYAFKYYIATALALAVIYSLSLSLFIIGPTLNLLLTKGPAYIDKNVPSKTILSFKNGEAKLDGIDSLSLPLDRQMEIKVQDGTNRIVQNLITINTKADVNEDSLEDSKSLIFLTKNSLLSYDEQGQVSKESISHFPDMTIEKEVLQNFIEDTKPHIRKIIFLIAFGILIFSFLLLVVLSASAVFMAIVCFSINKIRSLNISFSHTYKATLFALLPVLILEMLAFLGGAIFLIPFYFWIALTVLLVCLNFRKESPLIQNEENLRVDAEN